MKFTSAAAILAFATAAWAGPTPIDAQRANVAAVTRRSIIPFDPSIPITIFTNATCKLDKLLRDGQLISTVFPDAKKVGKAIGPTLKKALTPKVLGDIDKIAEDICVSAEQDGQDGNGICQDIFQAVKDLVQANDAAAADKYRCLLNLICVANETAKSKGTCQFLLKNVDCIANRILDEAHPECPKGI